MITVILRENEEGVAFHWEKNYSRGARLLGRCLLSSFFLSFFERLCEYHTHSVGNFGALDLPIEIFN